MGSGSVRIILGWVYLPERVGKRLPEGVVTGYPGSEENLHQLLHLGFGHRGFQNLSLVGGGLSAAITRYVVHIAQEGDRTAAAHCCEAECCGHESLVSSPYLLP